MTSLGSFPPDESCRTILRLEFLLLLALVLLLLLRRSCGFLPSPTCPHSSLFSACFVCVQEHRLVGWLAALDAHTDKHKHTHALRHTHTHRHTHSCAHTHCGREHLRRRLLCRCSAVAIAVHLHGIGVFVQGSHGRQGHCERRAGHRFLHVCRRIVQRFLLAHRGQQLEPSPHCVPSTTKRHVFHKHP